MPNRFLDRRDPTTAEEVNENQIVVNILRDEFPNDPLLNKGILSVVPNQVPAPVDEVAERNKYTGRLELDADISASYAEYPINKLVPSINDEELDDILDDEFEFYIELEEGGFTPPAPDGLFLKAVELDSTPFDFHDLYLRKGPETIPGLLADGADGDQLINQIFCIWYIERGQARPIPNYKTLEVMLVERGLTYADIEEATAEDFVEFDLRLDGRFQDVESESPTGESLPPPTLLDEMQFRSVIDRSFEWNYFTRFKSGYQLGDTLSGKPFTRDPGDYQQLRNKRILTEPSPEDIQDIRQNKKGLPWPKLPQNIPVGPRLYRYYVNDVEYFNANLIVADPDDFYQDTCLIPPSDLEIFRGEYEGKLILLDWPTNGYVQSIIENGTPNTLFDDLIFDLRFMIHGHLKQVLSLLTLKDIARINGIDIAGYDGTLENYPVNELTGVVEDAFAVEALDTEQYEALSAQNGIIQLLASAGAIEVLGETRIDTGYRRVWDEFSQIKQIDRLDPLEYAQYRQFESNNLDMFGIEELQPYEPPGALIYYPPERYAMLQDEALQQEAFDAAYLQILELFPPLAAKAADFASSLSGIQGGFLELVKEKFDNGSMLHRIFDNSESGSDYTWRLKKKKNNNKIKIKGNQPRFWKLCEVEGRIFRKMSKNAERNLFDQNGNPWHINTFKAKDGKDSDNRELAFNQVSEDLYNNYGPDSTLPLLSDNARSSMKEARTGNTPRSNPNDTERYGRPEKGGSRIRQLMKDKHYFKATVAQYIMEFIVDPAKYQSNSNSLPVDIINGNDDATLVDLASNADDYLAELTSEVEEINDYVATIDERIIQATTVEEILDILDTIKEAQEFIDSINTDLFQYLLDLEQYIVDNYQSLGKRIVEAVTMVRKSVNQKNSKYYIEWPANCQSVASLFESSDVYTKWLPDLE